MRPQWLDREWAAALALSTAHSAQHFFSSLLPPLIPILAVALSLPLWKLGALVSLYSLVSGFGQAPMGELSDRYDRRLLLAPGLGLMAVGYVVFGSALLLTAAVVQLVAGGLTDRYDHRTVIVGMFGTATLGLVALSYVQLTPLSLLLALLVVGGSIWGANPARDALVSDISPAEWEGRTFGYLWTVTQAFSAASPAVVGYVADLTSIQHSFKYLALATLLAGASAALLLSPRVYVDRDADRDPAGD